MYRCVRAPKMEALSAPASTLPLPAFHPSTYSIACLRSRSREFRLRNCSTGFQISCTLSSEDLKNGKGASEANKKPWWFSIFNLIFSSSSSGSSLSEAASQTESSSSLQTETSSSSPACQSSGETEEVKPKVSKARRGILTAEKAKHLRKEMRAMESFRDIMYHSAIASRLATPEDS